MDGSEVQQALMALVEEHFRGGGPDEQDYHLYLLTKYQQGQLTVAELATLALAQRRVRHLKSS